MGRSPVCSAVAAQLASSLRLSAAGLAAGAGQVEQVGAFGLVKLERARDAVQDGAGCAGQVSSLHVDVVVDANAGEQGDLLAPEPFHPAVAAVGGQPGLRG